MKWCYLHFETLWTRLWNTCLCHITVTNIQYTVAQYHTQCQFLYVHEQLIQNSSLNHHESLLSVLLFQLDWFQHFLFLKLYQLSSDTVCFCTKWCVQRTQLYSETLLLQTPGSLISLLKPHCNPLPTADFKCPLSPSSMP